MKLSYFADTDSLYIDLSEEPSVESREASEGVVLDYNASGRLVGIDIDEASKRVQMDKPALRRLSEAFGGVTGLAQQAGLNSTTLYRTLSCNGNPGMTRQGSPSLSHPRE